MHFEAFISSQKQDVQQHLEFMQKLYIALDEPDGVAGVAASRKQQPTLHEQILDHKSSGESEKLECSGHDLGAEKVKPVVPLRKLQSETVREEVSSAILCASNFCFFSSLLNKEWPRNAQKREPLVRSVYKS